MDIYIVRHEHPDGHDSWVHRTKLGAYRSCAQLVIKEYLDEIVDTYTSTCDAEGNWYPLPVPGAPIRAELKQLWQREDYEKIVEVWNEYWNDNHMCVEDFFDVMHVRGEDISE